MAMYTILVEKGSDKIISIGGANYEYPPWNDKMNCPEYEQIKVDEWPDDLGTPGKHQINKNNVKYDKKENKVKLK